MALIIEGADDLGKTTAAKRIVELYDERFCKPIANMEAYRGSDGYFPLYYAHMSRPNPAFDFFNDYTGMMSKYAVQDRFHIGALLWHEGVLPTPKLRIVEGRLLAMGSLIVVFYTSDDKWYEHHIRNCGRAQMFAPDKILDANKRVRDLVEKRLVWCDMSYDVRDGHYAQDLDLAIILDTWMQRLIQLPR